MSVQRFIIDININGGAGEPQEGSKSSAPPIIPLNLSQQQNQFQSLKNASIPNMGDRFSRSGFYNQTLPLVGKENIQSSKLKSPFTREVQFTPDIGGFNNGIAKVETGFGEYARLNSSRFAALGTVTARQIVAAGVDYRQHTSGDAYANAQLDNTMKLANYGMVLAMSGPYAPFVAIGIVVNEGISAASQAAKFNYDRKLERQQITNMQTIAGNVSYGRNRGSV